MPTTETGIKACIYVQVTELKLPKVHITNNFTASGLLKFCKILTTEPAMVPNIIPTIKSETALCMRNETISTKTSKNAAPSTAASTIDQPPATKTAGKTPEAIVINATPKLAPELTPRIYGSASGLRKSVCISKPATDSEAPATTAVMALGSRKFRIISWFTPVSELPEKIL